MNTTTAASTISVLAMKTARVIFLSCEKHRSAIIAMIASIATTMAA
jgi:hypothetical protein